MSAIPANDTDRAWLGRCRTAPGPRGDPGAGVPIRQAGCREHRAEALPEALRPLLARRRRPERLAALLAAAGPCRAPAPSGWRTPVAAHPAGADASRRGRSRARTRSLDSSSVSNVSFARPPAGPADRRARRRAASATAKGGQSAQRPPVACRAFFHYPATARNIRRRPATLGIRLAEEAQRAPIQFVVGKCARIGRRGIGACRAELPNNPLHARGGVRFSALRPEGAPRQRDPSRLGQAPIAPMRQRLPPRAGRWLRLRRKPVPGASRS